MKTKPTPILFSLPIHEKLDLPPRAELLPKIESGEIDHLDFKANVFGTGKIRNPYSFKDEDMHRFAQSFEGQPFLRNHDTYDIDARDGTIVESTLEGQVIKQTVRLTTRRGMTDFIEGKIDRFSIGWYYDDALCSICKQSWFSMECRHSPGRTYKVDNKDQQCVLIFINPKGKETSAVNTPAVEGTSITAKLQEYKLEVIGESNHAATNATRVHNTLTKGGQMSKKKKVTVQVEDPQTLELTEVEGILTEDSSPLEEQIERNHEAAAALLGEHQRQQELDAQLQKSEKTLIAMSEHLLTVGLSNSRLPEPMQAELREQFKGKVFEASDLQTAITKKRDVLAALTSADNVQGPGRAISLGFNSAEQFALAVADLFGLPREQGQENIKVHKLRGIQDAYLMATGDQYFTGGYFPEFALVTANFPGIVANVQNKLLIDAWKDFEQHYGWWKKIVTVEHFNNLNTATWVRTGTIASLPSIAERGEYGELAIGDIKETSEWGKYGGYVPLTIEAVLRDDLRAFKRMPSEVALAGMRNISEQVAAIFTQASGAGPTMTDTGALFNSTAQTTAGGHANLRTTALGTDYTEWNAIALAMFQKKLMVKNAAGYYGTGKQQALWPSIILVPAALRGQAETLFVPRWEAQAQNVSAVAPSWGGRVEVVTVPDWTDATDFAAVIDPKLRPGVMLGEIFGVIPQIFSASSEIDPAMFANDESRIKVRHFINVGVADDLPLHKSNVAG